MREPSIGAMTRIVVIDLHGQFTHLERRALRDLGVDTEIVDADAPADAVEADGIVLSGGPDMDRVGNAPDYLALDVPVLGGILLFFEAGWYGGNIYNAVNTAHKTNRRHYRSKLEQLREGCRFSLLSAERGTMLQLSTRF